MPTYEFVCEHCGITTELIQSIHATLPLWCSHCGHGEPDFHQDYQKKNILLVGSPTTVGQQSEINLRKLGKYGLEDKVIAEKQKRRKFTRKLPEGATLIEPSDELPWYRSGETPGLPKRTKPLNLDKIKDVKKYVQTGEEK